MGGGPLRVVLANCPWRSPSRLSVEALAKRELGSTCRRGATKRLTGVFSQDPKYPAGVIFFFQYPVLVLFLAVILLSEFLYFRGNPGKRELK